MLVLLKFVSSSSEVCLKFVSTLSKQGKPRFLSISCIFSVFRIYKTFSQRCLSYFVQDFLNLASLSTHLHIDITYKRKSRSNIEFVVLINSYRRICLANEKNQIPNFCASEKCIIFHAGCI